MKKVLLIHGAWHDERCWKDVSKLLEDKGVEVHVLSYPGNRPGDSTDVTFDDYIRVVKESVESVGDKVTIVGHSSAGTLMQMAISEVEDKLEKIIFNNAFILPDQKSQFEIIPQEVAAGMKAAAEASGINSIPADPNFVKHTLANEASEGRLQELLDILVPQPVALMNTPISAKALESSTVPKALLHCKNDMSLPEGAYIGMFKSLGEYPIVEIDGDHEALFTAPEVFVEGLMKLL